MSATTDITTARNQKESIKRKLTKRLQTLASTPSRETIQTISKWILFHRRHQSSSISASLADLISDRSVEVQRKVLYLTIVHEILTIDGHNNSSQVSDNYNGAAASGGSSGGDHWRRYSEIRLLLGESVVRPSLEAIRIALLDDLEEVVEVGSATAIKKVREAEEVVDKLKSMKDAWEKLDCFRSPTLMDEFGNALLGIERDVHLCANSGSRKGLAGEKELVDQDDDTKTQRERKVDEFDENENNLLPPSKEDSVSKLTDMDVDDKGSDIDQNADVDGNNDNNASDRISTPTPSDLEDEDDLFGMNDNDNTEDKNNHSSPKKAKGARYDDTNRDAETKRDSSKATNGASPTSSPKESGIKRKRDSAQGSIQEEMDYDFESEGIPYGKVEIHQLQSPCKSIATMQIARDLRSDTALQLSTLLSTISKEVEEECTKALKKASSSSSSGEDGSGKKEPPTVDLATIPPIPDDVLDLDLSDSIKNVRIYREIIASQREARQTCINLLIKSRCQFGSRKAAKMFYSLDSKIRALQRRKEKILDAMELEGLDFEGVGDNDGDSKDENLEDFSWFPRDVAADKQTKVE